MADEATEGQVRAQLAELDEVLAKAEKRKEARHRQAMAAELTHLERYYSHDPHVWRRMAALAQALGLRRYGRPLGDRCEHH